jgi:hypothetical protein
MGNLYPKKIEEDGERVSRMIERVIEEYDEKDAEDVKVELGKMDKGRRLRLF